MEKRTQQHIINNPMILHYYVEKDKIRVFYSNNKSFTYPYSVEKEIEITKKMKLQAEALAMEFKKKQRTSRLFKSGAFICMGAFFANIVACAAAKKEMSSSDVLFTLSNAAVALGFGFLSDENSKFYHEVRKLQLYMENYKALSTALVKSNYDMFGNDITKDDANNITKDDITSCTYEYLFEEAGLVLKQNK